MSSKMHRRTRRRILAAFLAGLRMALPTVGAVGTTLMLALSRIGVAVGRTRLMALAGDPERPPDEIDELCAAPRAPAADRVLTTVLFTDIVGSTELAAALGDARWRELMARHDELVRAELERHRGREIKTMGDGFLATFDGPARGIRCARAIGEAVRPLRIQIRAGLNTGECEIVGDDIAGLAVCIGARIGALADPDEVLVSSTVKDVVLGSSITFSDRGTHRLKGVPGSWRLFGVAGAE